MIGIYRISSKIKPISFYIGSAINIEKRWGDHLNRLKNGKHINTILQNHYNKYGILDLTFSVLLECDKEDLLKNEQYFIDSLNPTFNICKIAGSNLGRKFSDEHKLKISIALKGKTMSDECRAKMSLAAQNRGPEFRAKMSEAKKNISDETRLKMSLSKKARCISEETKIRMSIAQQKRRVSQKNNTISV